MEEEKKKDGRGGARKGAGRKAIYKDSPLEGHTTFRVSKATEKRIYYLRQFMKDENPNFTRRFENWVKEEAEKLGIIVE
jgi:hypothetical protein